MAPLHRLRPQWSVRNIPGAGGTRGCPRPRSPGNGGRSARRGQQVRAGTARFSPVCASPRATRAAAARRAAGPRPGRGFALRVVAPAVPRPLAAWCVAPAGVLRAT